VSVYEALRRSILSGDYRAGDRLRESTLAEALGTSRTPVRDALRRLHGDGLVELTPHRGARVTGLGSSGLADVFEIRAVLEGYAARRAAETGAADLELLTSLCDRMEAVLADADPGSTEVTDLNLAFHAEVHRAAGNALLPKVLDGVIAIGTVRRTFTAYDEERTRRSFAQHRDLVRALTAGDGAWAEAVMVAHLRGALHAVEPTHTPPTLQEETP